MLYLVEEVCTVEVTAVGSLEYYYLMNVINNNKTN